MKRGFRQSAATVFAGMLAFAAGGAGAQGYPTQPIRLVVPYSTGGVTDITARLVAPYVSEALGQQLVIENRSGGASIPGSEAVARAEPDGYTLLLTSTALAANPVLFKKLPFDARKDLAPISLLATVPTVLVVPTALPARNLKEFIALAKSRPGGLDYGSAGYGSGNHLTTEVFKNAAGIDAQHIPYKGGGAVMADLVGGQVSFVFAVLPTAYPFITSGKLRALAVSGATRNPALPDVPTVAEAAALPGFSIQEWIGIFAPAGTPRAIVDRVNAATVKALRNPELIGKLNGLGLEARGGPPEALRDYFIEESDRWVALAKKVKLDKVE
ncbi:tripartite tricarboxylate transporter substrate binding protein [Pigmentiphaga sp. YJ18]|uniref:tripartite tricarboxylate transporter substrate binding protein n=1 Tax=Pigmentiphaga sp. YJ18 TaxID=3134907 RepID=UPI003118A7B2